MKRNVKTLLIAVGAVLLYLQPGHLEARPFPTVSVPTCVVKKSDMSFGTLYIPSAKSTTAMLQPSNELTAETSNGAKRITNPGITAACVTLTGRPDYVYSITLPLSSVLTDGTSVITAYNFTSIPSLTGILNDSGSGDIYVGATVIISANQQPGAYIATNVPVVINYN